MQVLPLLQDGRHPLKHDLFLRHGPTRGGVHVTERQQNHLGDDQGAHGRDAVQNQLHEVQGTTAPHLAVYIHTFLHVCDERLSAETNNLCPTDSLGPR